MDIMKLKSVVPIIEEHLLPLAQDSAEVAANAYALDEFNDTYTFGCQLWKNLWNRITTLASTPESPVRLCGKHSEYTFRIGEVVLRHHRVIGNLVPRNAKAAKQAADAQLKFPFMHDETQTAELGNVILAVEAQTDTGLVGLYLGELIRDSEYTRKKYKWNHLITLYRSQDNVPFVTKQEPAFSEDEVEANVYLVEDEEVQDKPVTINKQDNEDVGEE